MRDVLSNFDVEILARTIWAEARGNPPADDLPVCFSVINRFRARRWYSGDTVAETCLIAYQYSSWNTNDPNRRKLAALPFEDAKLEEYRRMVQDAWAGRLADPTNGATHYYADTIHETPPWVKEATLCGQFGHHRFYKDVL